MPTIGTTSKPGGSWHAWGINAINQEAELLTMPVTGDLLTLAAWIGGWNDTPRVRLCVWDYNTHALLGQSAQFIVADEGAGGPAGGNVDLYTADLEAPVRLSKDQQFYCGFSRNPADKHQTSLGPSSSPSHYETKADPWPDAFEDPGGIGVSARRIGAYVADYAPVPGARVYRSGAWVEADAVQVYRSGAWVEADAVQLRRGAAWVDSE